jgi:hypothetical protein
VLNLSGESSMLRFNYKLSIFFLLILFSSKFLYAQSSDATSAKNAYGVMKTKIWLWADAIQVQFTEPYTNTSAVVYVKYDIAKTTVSELTVDSMGLTETSEVHPTLQRLATGSIYEIIMALRSLNLDTLEHINFNAPKDTTENSKGEYVYGVFLPINKKDTKVLAQLKTEAGKNIYRTNRLINERLIEEIQGFKPKAKIILNDDGLIKENPGCIEYLN